MFRNDERSVSDSTEVFKDFRVAKAAEREGNMKKKRIAVMMALMCMITGAAGGCGAANKDASGTEEAALTGGKGMGDASSATDGGDVAYEGKTESSGEWEVEAPAAGAWSDIRTESADMAAADVDVMPGEYSEPEFSWESTEIAGEAGATNSIEPQAGLLTAGEWCDNENWGFFANLVQTGRFNFHTFGIAPYERVVVQAASDGVPTEKVKVKLYTASGSAIAAAVTDHDGKAYLYYNLHGEAFEAGYVVLTKPDGSEVTADLADVSGSYAVEVQPDGGQQGKNPNGDFDLPEAGGWSDGQQGSRNVILRSIELNVEVGSMTAPAKALDVMFVFDTTGSMGDELLYLQKEFEDIAGRVADQSTRFSVNFYRDQGDEYVVRSNPFSNDIREVAALISAEYANGGGDYEEAVDQALLDAVMAHEWKEDAVKLMFLILDAPPHDTSEVAANLAVVVDAAAEQGIRIIPIASSGVDGKTEGFLRSIAMITGGTYTFLTNDSGIGGSHLEPTIGAYTVESLNDMIVRLIREYCGE